MRANNLLLIIKYTVQLQDQEQFKFYSLYAQLWHVLHEILYNNLK